MAKFTYTPDPDYEFHKEGGIRLICGSFQSHETGLPEWLKNSSDAYAREDAPERKRVIVVILDSGRRGTTASISCLDFVGMTSEMIERNFRVWADPESAVRGSKASDVSVQGGHGNGGKSYMTQMFDQYALLQTVKNGKGSSYGVESGSFRFGYYPDPDRGRDFPALDLHSLLEGVMQPIRCPLRTLPEAAVQALSMADGFTLITGVGPKDYGNRIPARELINALQEHPQMIRTLEFCSVYAVVNGELFNQGRPLCLPRITPMKGAEQPRSIPVPSALEDSVSGHDISTTGEGKHPSGTLTLRTSAVSMRGKKKGRHNIAFKTHSGYIGYKPVSELDVQSAYREHIYGECYLESLEPYRLNERARLATSPLTRAVEGFVSEQVEAYAKEFEDRERRRYNQEEKSALSKINDALDQWKNRFLDEYLRGLWGSGVGPGPTAPPPLPSGTAARIEIALTHERAGVGIAFRPTLKFFDKADKRIRSVPFRWISEDNNVAMVDEDLMIINTFSHGETAIRAETLDGKLKSNEVPLKVVRIHEIAVTPHQIQVCAGSRHRLEAVCVLSTGETTSSVYLEWIEDDPKIARVSASGLVFGFNPGTTKVCAGDDSCLAKESAIVEVIPGVGREKGFPQVLVSGDIDVDPDTKEHVTFSSGDPPVYQRPDDVDRNIWWINSNSPLAKMYLNADKGYGSKSREWRMYHLERYIDVIVQIALTQGPTEKESISVGDWIGKWGEQVADIQMAVASDLSEFIATGELPGD